MNETTDTVHRRYNPLTGDWILVSPHRGNRPWLGAQEASGPTNAVTYEPACPLCPNNTRANGEVNPDYANTFCFKNDFSALMADVSGQTSVNSDLLESSDATQAEHDNDLFQSATVNGECHVVCYSPDHHKSLALLTQQEIQKLIAAWQEKQASLARRYPWVQVFENKGETMGCSQPHPHGQIWAHEHIPSLVATEQSNQKRYFKTHGTNLLADYLAHELRQQARVVAENAHWVIVVPYWAAWPFETLLLPKRHILRLTDLCPTEVTSLADILQLICIKYDNLFQCSFPYSMGWHGAPHDDEDHRAWQLHAHFYPPLLRSATVKKFMVGYEMMAEPQRDITPEKSANLLRSAAKTHYSQKDD